MLYVVIWILDIKDFLNKNWQSLNISLGALYISKIDHFSYVSFSIDIYSCARNLALQSIYSKYYGLLN